MLCVPFYVRSFLQHYCIMRMLVAGLSRACDVDCVKVVMVRMRIMINEKKPYVMDY